MIKHRFFNPADGIGIYIDPHGLTAVQSSLEAPSRVRWDEQVNVAETANAEQLDRFFYRLQRQVGRQYIPLSIVLADPWVHQVLLGFDSLPRQARERETLIHWRLAREWQRETVQHAISWQWLGERDGQQWVIAQSIERQRLESVVHQVRSHDLILSGIDAAGNLLLNRLDDASNKVLLHMQTDYWTVYVTDEQGWPVYRRSKWQRLEGENQVEQFAAQLQRMLVSIGNVVPEQLVFCGISPLDDGQMDEILNRRLGMPLQITDRNEANNPGKWLAIQGVGNLCH